MRQSQQKKILFGQFSFSLKNYLVISLSIPNYNFTVKAAVSRPVGQHFLEDIISKAIVSRSVVAFLIRDKVEVSEEVGPYDCDFEFHDIHGQRSGFIGEDILDLSQFFVEGGALHGHIAISILAEHELVLLDEIFLEYFDDLHRYYQRNGDHGVEQDEVGQELDEAIHGD